MVGLLWKRLGSRRHSRPGQTSPRRPRTLNTACESLESRQLLSSATPGATEFAVPSTSLVTSAASILESAAPRAFAHLQAALTRAEQQSKVSPADATALAQDESAIEQEIESANLSPYETGNDLNIVQDGVDYAFTEDSIGFHVGRNSYRLGEVGREFDYLLGDVPAVFSATTTSTSTSAINQFVNQIKVVANQSRLAPAVQSALKTSYNAVNKALGRNPNTMPGPGGTARDPLIVYYDAQANNFLRYDSQGQ
jgi:hypothetical protein